VIVLKVHVAEDHHQEEKDHILQEEDLLHQGDILIQDHRLEEIQDQDHHLQEDQLMKMTLQLEEEIVVLHLLKEEKVVLLKEDPGLHEEVDLVQMNVVVGLDLVRLKLAMMEVVCILVALHPERRKMTLKNYVSNTEKW